MATDTRFLTDPPLEPILEERLIDLWTDVSNAGGAVGFVPPVTAEDVRPVARESFDRVRNGGDHLVVGLDGDEAVALAFLEHRPGPLFRHWATIKRLQVHPARQGTGLGGRLLTAVEDAARALDIEQLRLSVRGGTGTERFYVRHGYEVVATLPRSVRVAPGDDRDELWLLKEL